MDIIFERFNRGRDLRKQRKLYSLCFPESDLSDSKSEERYRWQFCDFPHPHNGNSSYEYAAFEDREMAGYYSAVPYRYRINDKVLTCGMVCDVMTHPDKRDRGIFKDIGNFATTDLKKSGVHFTSAYPIRKKAIPGHLRVGWKIAFDLPLFASLLKSDRLLKKFRMAFLSLLLNVILSIFNKALNFFWRKFSPSYEAEFLELSADSISQTGEFICRWEKDQHFYLIKDPAFLSWRLGKKGALYKIALLRNRENTVGASILRIVDFYGIPAVVILDYMILKEHIKASPCFLSKIKCMATSRNCEAVVVMLSKHWSKQYRLKSAGFLKSPYCFKFISKKLGYPMDENYFLAERNWHLSWIDSDRF